MLEMSAHKEDRLWADKKNTLAKTFTFSHFAYLNSNELTKDLGP